MKEKKGLNDEILDFECGAPYEVSSKGALIIKIQG